MKGLEPVVAALLADAEADAAATSRAAAEAAAQVLAAARERAAGILAQARELGAGDARAELAAQRMRVRRQARGLVLAARREAYEGQRAAAYEEVRRLGKQDGTREALVRLALHVLGPGADVSDAPDGGIVAENGGRRLDLSLEAIADRAMAAMPMEVTGP